MDISKFVEAQELDKKSSELYDLFLMFKNKKYFEIDITAYRAYDNMPGFTRDTESISTKDERYLRDIAEAGIKAMQEKTKELLQEYERKFNNL